MKLLSILLFGFALACSNNSSSPETMGDDYEFGESEEMAVPKLSVVSSITPPEAQEQKIIKTARLAFETKEVALTHQIVLDLTRQFKGLIQNDKFWEKL